MNDKIDNLINGKKSEEVKDNNDFFEENEKIVTVMQKELDRLYEICEILAKQRDKVTVENEALKDELLILKTNSEPVSMGLDKYEEMIKIAIEAKID